MCPVSKQNGGNRLFRCLQHDIRFKVDFGNQETKNGGTSPQAIETLYAYMTRGLKGILEL